MPRHHNRLTAKSAAATKAPGYHADGAGLYLRVQGAARSWVVVKVIGGKRKETRIGGPEMSLADARAARGAPAATHASAPAETFGEYADRIVPDIVAGFKNSKHRQQWENTTSDIYIKPLRSIPISKITTEDVLAILRPIWREKNETASRLRGRIERILGAAKAAGLRPVDSINPAAWEDHLEHFLTARRKDEKGHHSAMPWAELPAFMARLRANNSTSSRMLEFCILTWTRTTETRGARLGEFEGGVWTIPKERMKLGIEHKVPMTPRALAILKEMSFGMNDPDTLIFPGRKKGSMLSNMAMLMLLRRMAGKKYTVHGMRSAARDWAGDATDFPRDLAEMALAHAVGDETEQAYRRGTALQKRRALMEAWEAFLEGPVEPAL